MHQQPTALEFLERIESETTDKNTASKIQDYLRAIGHWPAKVKHVPKDPNPNEKIVYNAVTCLECGVTLQSTHTHDYKVCSCPNQAMVDGGHDYARYGAADMNQIVKTTYTLDDPHPVVRQVVCWGTRGIKGDEPVRFITLADMNDEHLAALAVYKPASAAYKILFKREIAFRERYSRAMLAN